MIADTGPPAGQAAAPSAGRFGLGAGRAVATYGSTSSAVPQSRQASSAQSGP
jgi:hypothetical protein